MAAYGTCNCGKRVSAKKDNTPRAHACNAESGPMWANLDHIESFSAQPIVPADVDETDPFVSPTGTYGPTDADRTDPFVSPTAAEHVHSYRYGDDDNGHSGSFCDCGQEEPEEQTDPFAAPTSADDGGNAEPSKGPLVPAAHSGYLDCGHDVLTGDMIRADGEGGWECEDCADKDYLEELSSPMVELLASIDDHPHPAENWNGTGRPRPSASTVKLPPAEPEAEKPRLLDKLAAASAGAGTVLDAMTPQQRAAAGLGLVGLAGQVLSAAQEAVQAAPDPFSSPTPQGSGPARGPVEIPVWDGVTRPVYVELPDPFSSPTPSSPVLGSATDQPETWRNSYGQYVIKDPRTGDYKRNRSGKPQGFTRATTFAKTLIDQFGIHQWEMRTLLAGLALRPDLAARAQGLDVAQDKDALQDIIAAAKEAAGGNQAASDGTEFHTVTEHLDAGVMDPADVPEKFKPEAEQYLQKMALAGLRTRPEWIERVLFTDRVGEDVAGTTDRIVTDRNGQHLIADVKSGKGVDLGQREIAMQLKHYAMSVNQFGLYKKTSPPPRKGTDDPAQTGHWEPWTESPVSEDYGIVMHVPLVRPAGTPAYCTIYRIDLRGVEPYSVERAHHGASWVRGWRKEKGFLSPYQPPQAAPEDDVMAAWTLSFSTVTSLEQANQLWEAAVKAGMPEADLAANVALARKALSRT